jgi:hypothetical protein
MRADMEVVIEEPATDVFSAELYPRVFQRTGTGKTPRVTGSWDISLSEISLSLQYSQFHQYLLLLVACRFTKK